MMNSPLPNKLNEKTRCHSFKWIVLKCGAPIALTVSAVEKHPQALNTKHVSLHLRWSWQSPVQLMLGALAKPSPADAHDAGPRWGPWQNPAQLMLMMLITMLALAGKSGILNPLA